MAKGNDYPEDKRQNISVLEEFDGELERFDKDLEALSSRLKPISTGRGFEESSDTPTSSEAQTELRSRLERLRNLIVRFENISDQIDL